MAKTDHGGTPLDNHYSKKGHSRELNFSVEPPGRRGFWRIGGAQPAAPPLFRRASKIQSGFSSFYSVLCLGQPQGDPNAGFDTHIEDLNLKLRRIFGAGC
jgi:hypothetical protein